MRRHSHPHSRRMTPPPPPEWAMDAAQVMEAMDVPTEAALEILMQQRKLHRPFKTSLQCRGVWYRIRWWKRADVEYDASLWQEAQAAMKKEIQRSVEYCRSGQIHPSANGLLEGPAEGPAHR